jgi:hypothetical protein
MLDSYRTATKLVTFSVTETVILKSRGNLLSCGMVLPVSFYLGGDDIVLLAQLGLVRQTATSTLNNCDTRPNRRKRRRSTIKI